MANCKSCGAEVLWVKLIPHNRLNPLNPTPTRAGNIRMLGQRKAAPASSATSTKLYEVTDQEGVTKDKELTPSQAEGFRKRGFSVVEVPAQNDGEAAE